MRRYEYLFVSLQRFKITIFMNMNEVTSLISNVGFPIAVCVALFYFMVKQEDKHRDETDKLSATVEANTKVLTELCTLIKTLVK